MVLNVTIINNFVNILLEFIPSLYIIFNKLGTNFIYNSGFFVVVVVFTLEYLRKVYI